jgi:hypothetical protein
MYLTLCGSSNTSTTDGLNNDSVAVVGQMAEAMMLVLAAGNLTAAVTSWWESIKEAKTLCKHVDKKSCSDCHYACVRLCWHVVLVLELTAAARQLMLRCCCRQAPHSAAVQPYSFPTIHVTAFDRNSYHPHWWAPRHPSSKHLPETSMIRLG